MRVGVVGEEGSDAWDEKMGDWWSVSCDERWEGDCGKCMGSRGCNDNGGYGYSGGRWVLIGNGVWWVEIGNGVWWVEIGDGVECWLMIVVVGGGSNTGSSRLWQ